MSQIKDIAEFSKLYKINVPKFDEFEYYTSVLLRSLEYAKLPTLISDMSNLEGYTESRGESVGKYKMRCLDRIKKYIEETQAYEHFTQVELSTAQLPTKNTLNQYSDEVFLSIDISSANYSILKTFDTKNQLLTNWSGLCLFLDIHPALAKSKSFRQLVFGNLNPRRNQRLQSQVISGIVSLLRSLGLDDEIVYISHDEIVVRCGTLENNNNALDLCLNVLPAIIIKSGVSLSQETYVRKKIEKDIYLKTLYSITYQETDQKDQLIDLSKISDSLKEILTENNISSYQHSIESEKYKTLTGVPGNQFYMYFKQHILNEPVEERDLLFWIDNRLAVWKT